jgi:SAM-dependent methyltransferase
MAVDCLADGFRLVDAQADIARFAACLAFLDGLPSFSLYKSYVCDVAARSGGPSLDVGCGLGCDVLRVARRVPDHTAFGIDLSERFLDAARARAGSLGVANAEFRRMDARRLQFTDGAFASTRVDRSLQHMAEPGRVVGEMVRVTRTGGDVILAEPDWGTFFVGDRSVHADGVSEYYGGKFRNPDIGRRVATLLQASGAELIDLRGYALMARGAAETDRVFDVERTCELLESEGRGDGYRAWWRELRRSRGVMGSVTIFIAVGRKT